MNRREAVRLLVQAGAVSAAVGTRQRASARPVTGPPTKSDARPNIVMIVADDLGFSDLSGYGGEIATPHLDTLARQGTQFTQFYNCAVCVTSRSAIMTGLHPRFGRQRYFKPGMMSVGDVMKEAGYQTSLIGKWHLGKSAPNRPNDRGFDEFYGVLGGLCNYFDPSIPEPGFAGGRRHPFHHNEKRIFDFPPGYYTTDAFTDRAIGEIEKCAASDRPLFLHLAYTAPHYPLHAPEEDIDRFRGRYRDGYEVIRRERYQRLREMGLLASDWALPVLDQRIGPWRYDYDIPAWDSLSDRAREAQRMEVYAAQVHRLDVGIGRVLDALRRSGMEDNTLVMFFSDNGGCASMPRDSYMTAYRDYHWQTTPGTRQTFEFCGPGWASAQSSPFRRYKTWTYEGGISTPMIARWPGRVHAGSVSHELCHVTDLMPTFIRLAETRHPKEYRGQELLPLEGVDMTSILMGAKASDAREVWWYLYSNRAYRRGRWKAVFGATRRRWELYDMEADRTETHDLAKRHPDIVAELSGKWLAMAETSEVDPNLLPSDRP